MASFDRKELLSKKEKTIPAGWYSAIITGGEDLKTRVVGNDYFRLYFEITDYAGEVNEDKFIDPIGERVQGIVSVPDAELMTEKKFEDCNRSFKKFIRAFAPEDNEEGQVLAKDMAGLEGRIKVKLTPDDKEEYKALKEAGREDEYEGEFYPEIAYGGFSKKRED